LRTVHPVNHDGHRQRRHLFGSHSSMGERIDYPVDLRIAEPAAVAFGCDDVDRVEGFRPGRHRSSTGRCPVRSSALKASGRISSIVLLPSGVAIIRLGTTLSPYY